MTRLQEIEILSRRYQDYMSQGKRKAAGIVYARLCSLVSRQLKSELRADRANLSHASAGRDALPLAVPATPFNW